jgi:monoamine oxidase
MGATTKVFAFYERTFWRERGLSGEALCPGGPISVVFDNTSHDGAQPCLLGFVVGRSARELARLPGAEQRRAALAVLGRFFGAEAERPTDVVFQDWSAEPWTRGCPVAVMPPGAHTMFGPALREPVGRLHWAGTETATEWMGYMEGALQSGERAAAEIAARL